MKLKTLLSLAWVLPLVPVGASAQSGYRDYSVNQLSSLNPANNKIANGIDFSSYYQWCDRYPLFLNQSVQWAEQLFMNMRYAEAKKFIIERLTLLANPGIFQNTQFRPYLFNQVLRSLALVKMLDSLPNGNQMQHDSMVTNVGIGQMDYLIDVFYHPVSQLGANATLATFDQQLVIPYTRDCRGNRAACRAAERQAQRQIIQAQLVNLARAQLETAQAYSSSDSSVIVPGRFGGLNVYDNSVPLVSADVYFNIITNVALWTATDLSYTGFSLQFSCVITELLNLRSEAHMAQSLFGDREGYRYIHSKVDTLIDALSVGAYGCGQIVYGVQAPNASTYNDIDGSGDGNYFNPYDYYMDGDQLAPTKKQNRKVKHAIKKHVREMKREERKESRND